MTSPGSIVVTLAILMLLMVIDCFSSMGKALVEGLEMCESRKHSKLLKILWTIAVLSFMILVIVAFVRSI